MSFSSELIKILDDLGRRLGIVVDWTGQNIAPYLQELVGRFINWEITTSILWIIIGIFFIIADVILLKKSIKEINKDYYDSDGWWFCSAINVMMILIGIIIIFVQGFDIAKTFFMPELKIYEYLSYLID